ncbi:hypothetical protein QUF90_13280 [Desulfococcaceae bacterium HSG9]|nr:hypothetical protein [Desulfococcaceae bacterium HSG9]
MRTKYGLNVKLLFIAVLVMLCLVSAPTVSAEPINRPANSPFWLADGQWLGTEIVRSNLYDLEPTVIYEPNAPDNQRFKMWWQGQKDWPSPVDELFNSENRIYFSSSEYGFQWSEPKVVFDPLFGSEPRITLLPIRQ